MTDRTPEYAVDVLADKIVAGVSKTHRRHEKG